MGFFPHCSGSHGAEMGADCRGHGKEETNSSVEGCGQLAMANCGILHQAPPRTPEVLPEPDAPHCFQPLLHEYQNSSGQS